MRRRLTVSLIAALTGRCPPLPMAGAGALRPVWRS